MRNMQIRRSTRNRFAEEPSVRIGRSQFDWSKNRKMSFLAGYLTPMYLEEIMPGTTLTLRTTGFARIFSPLDAPVMDNIEVQTYFFFVPCRLVWDNWKYFMGEHDDAGVQDTDYTVPVLATGLTVDHGDDVTVHGLAAYLGLPDGMTSASTAPNALPFRAYNLIYNQWFRDQNLIDERIVTKGDGPDTLSNYALRKGAKKHDYFTSALPYVQKGTAQSVSLQHASGVSTDLVYVKGTLAAGDNVSVYSDTLTGYYDIDTDAARADLSVTLGTSGDALYIKPTDLTVDINALRTSVAYQRLLERDARGGTRYVELIKSHFGVTNPDFRLQRSEYLGGGRSYINISPVANTSGVDSTVSISGSDEPQGELHGTAAGTISGGFAKSFTEHGYVIGLIRARGDVTYFQGIQKMWTRSSRFDFYIPALAHLGEQAILNRELYNQNGGTNTSVFGYQERWAEYRSRPSEVVGLFNPDTSGSLSFWHLAEDFSSAPSLNQTFIEDQTPMTRIKTVATAVDFICDIRFDVKAALPMPVRSIPSLTGRL